MIKSLWWSFKRNVEGPLLTLVAALILCAIIGVPAALLSWGFCSLPEAFRWASVLDYLSCSPEW